MNFSCFFIPIPRSESIQTLTGFLTCCKEEFNLHLKDQMEDDPYGSCGSCRDGAEGKDLNVSAGKLNVQNKF